MIAVETLIGYFLSLLSIAFYAYKVYVGIHLDDAIFRVLTKNAPKLQKIVMMASVAAISTKLAKFIHTDLADGRTDDIEILNLFLDKIKTHRDGVKQVLWGLN